jgi:hypothetical protein
MFASLLEAAKSNPFGGIRQAQLDKCQVQENKQGIVAGRTISAANALPGGE